MDTESAGQKQRIYSAHTLITIPEEIHLGDDRLNTVTTFKYLGLIFNSHGGAESDINNRACLDEMEAADGRAMWQKKMPIKRKDKVYKTVIKPTLIYGAECWAVRKKDENIFHVAEMRMLRWIRDKTRKDHVKNQVIQEDAQVCQHSRDRKDLICMDT